jgi:cytochrome b561
MSPSELRYTRVAVALHWLVALLVVAQIAWGFWMQQIPKQPPGVRADAFNLHKSGGMLIFALMVARLGWRLGHPPPALPPLAVWQRVGARVSHTLLYVLLIAQPLVGYLGSVWSGYPVRFFGLLVPAWGSKDTALKDLMSQSHAVIGGLLIAVIIVHIAAALRHAVARDGVLQRMTLRAPNP